MKDEGYKEIIEYPEVGKQYKHYKGGVYEVLTLATHSETNEPLVIYKSVLFGSVHARPLSMWFDKLKVYTTPDLRKWFTTSRFELIR